MNTKKLNILFLCSWYPSRVFRANGDFIQRHAEAVANYHNVTALHIVTDKTLSEVPIVYDISTIRDVVTKIAYIKHSKNPFIKVFRFCKAFYYLYKSEETIDLVHLNTLFPFGIFALYIKVFNKIPYLITEHWTAFHKGRFFFPRWTLLLMRVITKHATYVVPVSNDLGKSMKGLGLRGNYKRVPNVVKTNMFMPVQNNDKKEGELIIVHISSMIDDHKNISGLLSAINKMDVDQQPYKCYFIGGKSPVENTNTRVNFIEFVEQSELIKYLHKADVFVLFSNTENLPCVILESFSCGVPVVSTNVGGIEEYFPDDFGVLIDKGDEERLTNVLQNWDVNNYADKEKMYAYVQQHFSPKSIAKQYIELYIEMLKR